MNANTTIQFENGKAYFTMQILADNVNEQVEKALLVDGWEMVNNGWKENDQWFFIYTKNVAL